jgi:hypothetical protein
MELAEWRYYSIQSVCISNGYLPDLASDREWRYQRYSQEPETGVDHLMTVKISRAQYVTSVLLYG